MATYAQTLGAGCAATKASSTGGPKERLPKRPRIADPDNARQSGTAVWKSCFLRINEVQVRGIKVAHIGSSEELVEGVGVSPAPPVCVVDLPPHLQSTRQQVVQGNVAVSPPSFISFRAPCCSVS